MIAPGALRHPAAWYLGIALGLPVAGGAELDAAFAEHAVTVLAVSGAVLAAWQLAKRRGSPLSCLVAVFAVVPAPRVGRSPRSEKGSRASATSWRLAAILPGSGPAVSSAVGGLTMPVAGSLKLDRPELADFCRRWKVCELAVFGSALREDFRADSDVDLLVSFAPDATWGLLEWVTMEDELAAILGRPVDLVSRRAIERSANWIRREAILGSAEAIHVAR